MDDDVNHLPRPAPRVGRAPEQRFALQALSLIRLAEPEKLAVIQDGERPNLQAMIDELGDILPALSDSITQQYLSHLQTTRHLAGA